MVTAGRKRWSQRVTEKSNALDLEQGVFSRNDPRSIARSLKRSADRSQRRKSGPFRSAMSMLTFYLNRAGKNSPGLDESASKQPRKNCATYMESQSAGRPEVFGRLW